MKQLLIYISFFFSLTLFAQQRNVAVYSDSTKIRIGQQFVLHLEANYPAQEKINWPAFEDTLGAFEIIQRSKIDTSYDPNNITTKLMRQNLLLTSFDSGYFPIPAIAFQINDSILESDPLLIEVQTVAIDTSKGIYDIKEPYQVPFNLMSWLKKYKYWIAGGALLVAILASIITWLILRKPKIQEIIQKPKPKIPAHKIAMKKLRELEHQKLWQHNKVKQYHSSVSEIIREYLENRFNILALETTTPEILIATRSLSISDEERNKLQQILELSDLVKFAKAVPVANENELSLKNAVSIVESTIPNQEKKNG